MLQNVYLIISELGRGRISKRSGRRRCNDYPAIDIRHPQYRQLVDDSESRISWRWNRNGKPLCNIDIVFHPDYVLLTDVTDAAQLRTVSISLTRTPCHYGGSRSWFECPRCTHQCAKLYFCDGGFGCRQCHGLAYRSQLEASSERPRLIAQRIRRSLGGSSNLTLPFPAKPPKMHWQTYYAIRAKCERFEARAIAGLAARLEGHNRHILAAHRIAG